MFPVLTPPPGMVDKSNGRDQRGVVGVPAVHNPRGRRTPSMNEATIIRAISDGWIVGYVDWAEVEEKLLTVRRHRDRGR
jgi:hypothetical protein